MTETSGSLEGRRRAGDEGKARTLVRIAATTTVVGIFLASAGDESLARWVTVAGLLLLVLGLHRFGRLGADEPIG